MAVNSGSKFYVCHQGVAHNIDGQVAGDFLDLVRQHPAKFLRLARELTHKGLNCVDQVDSDPLGELWEIDRGLLGPAG
jgi:hypothetical protein